jgi:hypothetical protein
MKSYTVQITKSTIREFKATDFEDLELLLESEDRGGIFDLFDWEIISAKEIEKETNQSEEIGK